MRIMTKKTNGKLKDGTPISDEMIEAMADEANVATTSIPLRRGTEAVVHAWVLRSHQSNRYA